MDTIAKNLTGLDAKTIAAKLSNDIKVIKIINDKELVINFGYDDGIRYKDILEIYQKGEDIIDPFTKANLGSLDFIKARIVAKTVLPKMSVCVNADTYSSEIAKSFSSFIGNEGMPLNIDSKEISGGYEDVDKKIRVGDCVRKIRVNNV